MKVKLYRYGRYYSHQDDMPISAGELTALRLNVTLSDIAHSSDFIPNARYI